MNCYICNHSDFRFRQGGVRDNPELLIHECINCGLVALNSFEHIKHGHYENSGMHGEELPSIESWLRKTEQDDRRRFELLKVAIVNRKVLDFGCGAGGFLRKVQKLATVVAGVELEHRVREHWVDSIPIYESLADVSDKYDLITSFHVLEHLLDPREMLRCLASHLRVGGRLVIEVPNSDDALLTLYESDAFQRFTYWSQHLYLFNSKTLHCLANQAGLKVISIQQFQRYPLSNHLYWLSRNKPGGHQCWSFLDTQSLSEAYTASLAAIGKCDTIIAYLENE